MFKKGRQRRKLLAGLILFALVFLIPAFLNHGKAYSVEGLWRSFQINCLCDSYSFWQLKDGKIVRFSDKHLTDWNVGFYTKISEGTYRLTFPSGTPGVPPVEYTVQPGKKVFYGPKDPADSSLRRWLKRFRRIPMTERERDLVGNAWSRDVRIQKEIDKWEAEQAAREKANLPDKAAHGE